MFVTVKKVTKVFVRFKPGSDYRFSLISNMLTQQGLKVMVHHTLQGILLGLFCQRKQQSGD